MLKVALRKKYLQKRKTLSSDEVFLLSESIFKNFINYFNPVSGQKVHIFIPIEKFREIDTRIFIKYFLEQKIHVFVPKIAGKLISVEITENTQFETNKWDISEPVSNVDSGETYFDYVITPLVYCDNKGNRAGYGKGFYDSFFQSISSSAKKVGINYFNPDEDIDDIWGNDVPLDYLVTPTDVLSFFNGEE
nr:5-formyltetrahydrofolate cyclo-ligase [Chryseobacterium sp. H1D6B]